MRNMLKMFFPLAAVIVMGADAARAADATGRAAYSRVNRAAAMDATNARMPSMPVLPINSVGNISTDVPTGGGNSGGPVNPDPGPDNPDPGPDDPTPGTDKCPDGGVKNSKYTVENCMNDIQMCINNGALPNGMNEMFSEDVRNAIIGGMNLCQVQVEKCIREVRVDCNGYNSAADVWVDFNARRVQPEYYNFVLRKTGLTPNQAENTCLLLDRNVYGSSFDAVSTAGNVTAEYNSKVGAYNGANGNILIKKMPQGATVNSNSDGVDGGRGHYARWDPATADCYIRVAAYNKDTHIKNSWLFGAAGDDEPAEVWRAAGDTFSCNKDLFGFSLMNKTSTAAVVGVAGGTVLGAGVGAIAAHGKRTFDCDNEKHREMLLEELQADATFGILSEYLPVAERISATTKGLTTAQCENIVTLYDKYTRISTALLDCNGGRFEQDETEYNVQINLTCPATTQEELTGCFNQYARVCATRGFDSTGKCTDYLMHNICAPNDSGTDCRAKLVTQGVDPNIIYISSQTVTHEIKTCTFKPINLAKASGDDIYCADGEDCVSSTDIRRDVERLGDVFSDDLASLIRNGEKSTIGKGIGIGAAVGAGTGGIATAITAFVERSNINCRVGDNLAQVGYGKSYSIGSLKDFYVKWNLRLPDTAAPIRTVTNCDAWTMACKSLTDLNQCKGAQVRYTPKDAAPTLIYSACAITGDGICTINETVAITAGACAATPAE